jgi:hypothetical protein
MRVNMARRDFLRGTVTTGLGVPSGGSRVVSRGVVPAFELEELSIADLQRGIEDSRCRRRPIFVE